MADGFWLGCQIDRPDRGGGYRHSHQKMSTRLSPRRMSTVIELPSVLGTGGRAPAGPSVAERRFAWRRRPRVHGRRRRLCNRTSFSLPLHPTR
jgi:hypothetical protein